MVKKKHQGSAGNLHQQPIYYEYKIIYNYSVQLVNYKWLKLVTWSLDWWQVLQGQRKWKVHLLFSSKVVKKWFHKYDLSLDFKVVYDASMSIIGMAFHKDGKRWK